MDKAGKGADLTVHWYDACHAFANPTGSRYDQADAALARQHTLDFDARNLTAFGRLVRRKVAKLLVN